MEKIEDSSPMLSSSEAKTTAVAELQMVLDLVEKLGHDVGSSPLLGEITGRMSKVVEVLKAVEQEEALGQTAAGSPAYSVVGKSENSGFKKKKKKKKLVHRKRSQPYNIKERSSTLEDGYTWRKYGQKLIYGAKHPRSYYRCTYKHARGCQARKQTQKTEDDDTTYDLIYVGQHTCRNAQHQIPDGGGGGRSLDDQSTHPMSCGSPISQMVPNEPDVGVPQATAMQSPSPAVPAKQECAEQDVFSVTTAHEYPPLTSTEQTAPPVEASNMPTITDAMWEFEDVTSGFFTTEALFDMWNFF